MFAVVWLTMGSAGLLVALGCVVVGLQRFNDIWHARRSIGRRLLVGGLLLLLASLLLLAGSPIVHDFLK